MGAIILAGGKSSRMGGVDKATLPFHGMTLLEHVMATLLDIESDLLVVADTPDKYKLAFGRQVADMFPGSGPVGGILTGLTTLGPGSHFVVACDMPALKPAVLQFLARSLTPDVEAVVPEINGRLEPLCAVYRDTCARKFMKFLEDGGTAAHTAVKTLLVKRVGEGVLRRVDPELICFTNINTPEDLAAYWP